MLTIDKLKVLISLLLVIGGVAGYYYLGNSAFIIRLGVIFAGLILASVLSLTSGPGKRFISYSQESIAETKKVVWPTRKETIQVTAVVFLFVIVLAIFLWIVDAGLSWVFYDLILSRGK